MLKHLRKLGLTLSIAALTFVVSFKAPQLHNDYLRWEVGESVVQVLSPDLNGGGTGFAIKADSGQEFIMTNKHVCEVGKGGWVAIKKDGGTPVFKRIVYKDRKHDLCLIEGDRRLSPLTIGSYPEKGEIHYVVGHPGLRQLTVASGEFIGFDTVELLDEVKTRQECRGKIYELNPFQQIMYGIEFACIRSYLSYATSAVVYGGNSGSPAVNEYGNLIGVVFAGNPDQEKDNYLVPLYEVKRVLAKF